MAGQTQDVALLQIWQIVFITLFYVLQVFFFFKDFRKLDCILSQEFS